MSLVFDNISKTVGGETHIHRTDVRLEPGSFNTLLGRTGAGKTTFLRLMAGLERPSTGRLLMGNEDVTGVAVRRRNVAMVYQQFVNFPNFTVFENIASPLVVAGVAPPEIDRRVREIAAMLHLETMLDRLPSQLSGGQQQRVALARALVKRADLLLLDEPLVNLDFKLREELRAELRELLADSTAIVVYATAEPQEALALGGETIVVDQGRILQQGPATEVYRNPVSIRVATLVGDPPMNMVDGAIEGAALCLGGADPVPVPDHLGSLPDGPCVFGVRPHHVRMGRGSGDQIAIRAKVDLAEISGSETAIHFEHSGSLWVSQQDGVHQLDADASIDVSIWSHRLFVFGGDGSLMAAPDGSPDSGTV